MRLTFGLVVAISCCWCLPAVAQVANDTCTSAQPITGSGIIETPFDSTGAQTELGYEVGNSPQAAICAAVWFIEPIVNDVWFTYQAPGPTTRIATCDTSYDTKLEVYTGCPQMATNLIACNDDACGPVGFQSQVIMSTTPGVTYWIRVGGWQGSAVPTGPGTLTIESVMGPSNDECVNAIDLGSGTTDANYDNSLATTGVNQPAVTSTICTTWTNSTCEFDIWYKYTAASTDTLFELCDTGTNTDTVLEVYSGCPASTATLLACDDDGCDPTTLTSSIALTTTPGDMYFVRVGSWALSQPGTGTLLISALANPVTNVVCTTGGPGAPNDYTISFDWPATAVVGDTVEISSDEPGALNPIGTVTNTAGPGAPDSFTGTLLVANQGMQLNVTFEVRFQQGLLTSLPETCVLGFSPQPGDECGTAVSLGGGTVTVQFDNTFALNNGPDFSGAPTGTICNTWTPNGPPDEIFGDLYYTYTADPTTTEITVSACSGGGGVNPLGDTKVAIYSVTTCPPDLANLVGCDDDNCGNFLSEATAPVTPGDTYLIQVGSWSTVTRGSGTLIITPSCPAVSNFDVAFDCLAQVVTVSWTENAAYTSLSLTANGVPVAVGPTPIGVGAANSFSETPLLDTNVTYELTATCANGTTIVVSGTVNTAVPGAENLILHLELADDVDSGTALETALLANSVTVVRITDAANPCLADLVAAATNIWVILGTFPADAELSQVLGDLLYDAVQNSAKNVYLEGGDHWLFDPPSDFDRIDGVDTSLVVDGDDSLDLLVASNATTGGLTLLATFPTSPVYNQANLGGNDWTDRLQLLVDADLTSAEIIWRNDPGPNVGIETDYIVGIASVTTSGQRTIVCSFEFGGVEVVGSPTAAADLAGLYLSFFNGPSAPKFQRGDCNSDNAKNIADPVRLLNFLFPTMPPPIPLKCDDACDANDDGGLNIADAVAMLNVLFPTGPPITWPAPDLCGIDPTMDAIGCADYTDAMGVPWCP